ncbi:hypothetical protein EB796_011351 [Bugula neritina]|uniref:Uncharacterized protein n=1 Tax=Bugula neritina TaxID=10212 RepID=A0A7J7JYE9_BUGNE|nr:hypothetical protein EB796_011351 [Bugula neritina]
MPESLPDKMRPTTSWGSHISWEKADPFGALKKLGHDKLILLLCFTVLLSYLPEAGEYSCFFVYLKLVMNFSEQAVASYIAFVGILSVLAQTVLLAILMSYLGAKTAIIIGLSAETIQLTLYGFGSTNWVMWVAGFVASVSSITYPAISAFVSSQANPDQQGVAQGVVTGIRGLCMGLGPALFGFVFYMFNVDLNDKKEGSLKSSNIMPDTRTVQAESTSLTDRLVPGPPFALGAILVLAAIVIATFIPESIKSNTKSAGNGGVVGRQLSRQTSNSTASSLLSPLLPAALIALEESRYDITKHCISSVESCIQNA